MVLYSKDGSIQDVLDENMSEKKPKLDPNFKERLLVID